MPSTAETRRARSLEYRLNSERLISHITSGFIDLSTSEVDARIHETLRMLGRFAGVDRCYVFQFEPGGDFLSNTHEWCAAGIAALRDGIQRVPADAWPWALPRIKNFQTLQIPRVADLPDDAAVERTRWLSMGVRSMLVVPISRDRHVIGFLGFEANRREKAWSDDDVGLLQTVAGVLVNAWARQQAEQENRDRLRRMRRQQAALGELVKSDAVTTGSLKDALAAITASAAGALEIARVGVWLISDDRRTLRCLDLYERQAGTHMRGTVIATADYPEYFNALASGRAIDAGDACRDPRTCELAPGYLEPLGVSALLDATIRVAGRVVGVVCHEHCGEPRRWTEDELSFAGNVADLAAQALLNRQRRRTEQALRRAKEAAETSSRAKSEFLANMSHEIRTPLNCIIGLACLLQQEELPPAQRGHVAMIQHAGESLLAVINDILDVSKIEAGRLALEPVGFDLQQLVEDALGPLRPLAEEKGLTLSLRFAPGTPRRVEGDPGRIRQVLTNLVNNAIKFTPQGRVQVRVCGRECRGREAADPPAAAGRRVRLRVAVQDTGIGVPRSLHAKIFDKFTQADASTTRKYGGTGLGLAICRQLVELMGGRIGLESTPGEGATFWFTLELPIARSTPGMTAPAVETVAGAAPARRACSEPAHAAAARGEAPLVLLAEDNPLNQKVAVLMLGKLGCRVEIAQNGEQAVTMSRDGRYQLVLMDCQMPELDGYAAAARIRREERAAGRERTPIIALTAHAMSGDRERCLAAGMDDFLSKPIKLEALESALDAWLSAPVA